MVTRPPILLLPHADLPFSVDTDACDYQIGRASKTSAWRSCAVQLLRPYLEQNRFELFTDHLALKLLLDLTGASSRLAQWRLRLLEVDFAVRYKKGAKNQIADALSRLPTHAPTEAEADLEILCFALLEGGHAGALRPC